MLHGYEEKKKRWDYPERRKSGSINPPLQRLKLGAQVEHFLRPMRLNN
jgi:hypothetical protein